MTLKQKKMEKIVLHPKNLHYNIHNRLKIFYFINFKTIFYYRIHVIITKNFLKKFFVMQIFLLFLIKLLIFSYQTVIELHITILCSQNAIVYVA